MISWILFIFFILAVLYAVFVGAIIYFHFKRFGMEGDKNVQKILSIFRNGAIVIIIINIAFLFLFKVF